MTKREFLDQLNRKLFKLPKEEREKAMEYYREYFEESGEENEQKTIAELGSPANIASQLIANYAINDSTAKKSKGLGVIWTVLLAIFASPIALPIALAFACVIIALVIALLCMMFAFFVTGIALAVSGLGVAVLSFSLLYSMPSMLVALGGGLLLLGFGGAILLASYLLAKVCVRGIAKLSGKFLLRRTAK